MTTETKLGIFNPTECPPEAEGIVLVKLVDPFGSNWILDSKMGIPARAAFHPGKKGEKRSATEIS